MRPLAETYDVALLDLDGTVYLGGTVIDQVPQALAEARSRGMITMFVSNNASRPPALVAESLSQMGIHASEDTVLTSPQAAAEMLAQVHPAGSAVLVVGAPYLHDAIAEAGLRPVELATDEPVAVVQGHSSDTGWRQLAEACVALRAGADWVACNTDSTLPTDRGLLPGNGAMVAALEAATGLHPRVAGKPARPLLDAAIERAGAQRPLVVGDRLDTDIEAAAAAGLPALMPLTGVNSAADLLAAPPHRRPTHVCLDLRGLVDPDRVAVLAVGTGRRVSAEQTGTDETANDDWTVERADERFTLSVGTGTAAGPDPQEDAVVLRALAALLTAAWQYQDTADPQQDRAQQDRPRTDVPRIEVAGSGPAATAVLARLGLQGQDS